MPLSAMDLALRLLKSRWLHYGLMALAVWAAWQRGDHWKGKADDLKVWQDEVVVATREAAEQPRLKTASVAQQVRYLGEFRRDAVAKMEQVKAEALAAKRAADERNDHNKERSDESLKAVLPDARRRAGDYARANRVRGPKPRPATVGSDTRDTDLPEVAFGAGQPQAPGGEADMVAISRADFDTCTLNTVRLENAVEWAGGLEPSTP